jgi:hypothetical protein
MVDEQVLYLPCGTDRRLSHFTPATPDHSQPPRGDDHEETLYSTLPRQSQRSLSVFLTQHFHNNLQMH